MLYENCFGSCISVRGFQVRIALAFIFALLISPAAAQNGQSFGPNPACSAFGVIAGTCAQGNDARFPTGNWPTTTGNGNFLSFNGTTGAPQDSGVSFANPGAIGSGTAATSLAVVGSTFNANASGSNATATGDIISNALSTGTATNPDLVFKTGVKTTTGSSLATATTALTIKGETQQVQLANGSAGAMALTFGTDSNGWYRGGGSQWWYNGAPNTPAFRFSGSGGSAIFEATNQAAFKFDSSADFSGSPDTSISRASAGVVQVGTGTNGAGGSLNLTNLGGGGRATFGSTTLAAGQAGDLGQIKETDAAAAPGAGYAVLKWVAGSGTSCNLIAYAGTSATPVTIASTVGSGC
jgi:hypothetical protein